MLLLWVVLCAPQRHEAVVRFRRDASVRVALLSITAAAVGLDFSSASVVVFVELPYEVRDRGTAGGGYTVPCYVQAPYRGTRLV